MNKQRMTVMDHFREAERLMGEVAADVAATATEAKDIQEYPTLQTKLWLAQVHASLANAAATATQAINPTNNHMRWVIHAWAPVMARPSDQEN